MGAAHILLSNVLASSIGSPKRYYFEDVGLRNARPGFRQVEQTHIMENIDYNELRARGFSVDVGASRNARGWKASSGMTSVPT